jgi:7SK snRNA methylphosphate capping enzyme
MSVSMWIHLNFGDIGIIRLFDKIAKCLNIGGIFVFEPYEWSSYKKKKCFSEIFKENFKKI